MYTSKHLDWLSCTISQAHDFRSVYPTLNWKKSGNGRNGYKIQFTNPETGLVAMTDSDNPEMGSHFTFSGDTLTNFRQEQGGTDATLIARLVRYGAKASRIDLTLNIHDGHITPRSTYDALKKGELRARADTFRFIEGKKGDVEGDTLYIGAPASDRQFRCYNKASEIGVVDRGAWVRLELELRRIRANGAFQSCGVNGVVETVTGHLSQFLDWRNNEYVRALGANSVEPIDVPRKETNRKRWLLGQVASALVKEIALDRCFLERFMMCVTIECQRLDIDLTKGE